MVTNLVVNGMFFILVLLTLVSCGRSNTLKHGDKNILPFELIIYDSDYSMAYSRQYVLTEIDLKIMFNGGQKDEKDSTVFRTDIERNEAWEELSNINLDSL